MLSASSSSLDSFVQFVTVLIIFLFVLLLTYLTTRWAAHYQKGKLYSKNMEVVETFKLTQNKYLQIVRAGDKYLVLALGKDTITMLTELEKDAVVLQEDEKEQMLDFREILEKVKTRKPKK